MTIMNRIAHDGQELEPSHRVELVGMCVRVDRTRAGDVFHREIGHADRAGDVGATFIYLRYVWMMQPSEELCFSFKPSDRGARAEPGAHKLQRNNSSGLILHGLVDHAHSTGCNLTLDLIFPDEHSA